VHDVVHGPHREPVIEDVSKQFDHAADGTMADQHQGQDKLPQPSLGDRVCVSKIIEAKSAVPERDIRDSRLNR
jgi:hypothetical protein